MVASKHGMDKIPTLTDFQEAVRSTPQLAAQPSAADLAPFFAEFRAAWEYINILFTPKDDKPNPKATIKGLKDDIAAFYGFPISRVPILAAVISHGLTMEWTSPLDAKIALEDWRPKLEGHPNRLYHAKEWRAGREPRKLN